MKRSLRIQLALGILALASCQLYAAGRQSDQVERQPVNVHVYDLAGVSARDLREATQEAGRILATSGMQTVWQFGPADAPEAHELDFHAETPYARNQPPNNRNYLVLALMRDFPAGDADRVGILAAHREVRRPLYDFLRPGRTDEQNRRHYLGNDAGPRHGS